MPIDTVEDLREHLLLASRIELSLVPPYLYAMYSIADQQGEAAQMIKSVVVEEMLHATLATNLLLAVGGEPDFRTADAVPRYPSQMYHHVPPVMLNLARCSPELVRDVFLVVERPEERGAPTEADYYETQGQFYYAIEEAIEHLDGETDLFANPQVDRQLTRPDYYGTVAYDADDSGGLVRVEDLSSAVEAIEIVVHQGEGLSDERWADPAHQELTHYYKFLAIADGSSPMGEVYPAMLNPTTADLPESLRPVSEVFNAGYREVYHTMADLFERGADQGPLISRLYTLMSRVLSPVATFLMQQPVGEGVTAGPTFELCDLGPDRAGRLGELADVAARAHPALDPVASYLQGA